MKGLTNLALAIILRILGGFCLLVQDTDLKSDERACVTVQFRCPPSHNNYNIVGLETVNYKNTTNK